MKVVIIPACHPDRKHLAKGKCGPCWTADYVKNNPGKKGAWPSRSKAVVRAAVLKYTRKLKVEVLTHYGNGTCACVRCGFSDLDGLTIDHINGGGRLARKDGPIYGILKRQGFPVGHQTLCANCNTIKEIRRRRAEACSS